MATEAPSRQRFFATQIPFRLRRFLHALSNSSLDRGTLETYYVYAITLIGIPDITASILIEHATGNDRMALFMGFIMLCALGNILLFHRTHNTAMASTGVLSIILLMLSMMLLDGMYQHTGVIWLATFPAVAFFFKGTRDGLKWLAVQIAIILLIILAQWLALVHSPYSIPALVLIVASVLTVGMMIFVYESMRERADASLSAAQEQLHHLAHTDALTNLPNRIAFYNRLPEALAEAERDDGKLAVMFIDLDNFKPINDTYGHEVGDQLLCQAAARLRENLRGSDYIARIGGDEFVAILPQISHLHEAGMIADKLIKALATPFLIQDHRCTIGVSIGIGLYPLCASNIDDLVQLADHAMYKVKKTGKNGYALCPFDDHTSPGALKGKCYCNEKCHHSREFEFPH